MPTEFYDQENRTVHSQFQKWRRHHPTGFFLAFGARRRARLHAALCPHSGDVRWTFEQTGESLTTRRKVCADKKESLLALAAREGVQVAHCADCLRGSPAGKADKPSIRALTAFSWGYWGWGNAVPRFLEAATASEAARGFGPPAFADIRLSRGVRAPGFSGTALERVVGSARYRWFKGLGNACISTGELGVRIADPAQAETLLEFIQERAADSRRVLFFCACPVERLPPCHRKEVARLLLRAAHARRLDLTVVEWPGGEPESRELTVPQGNGRGSSIPLGQRLPRKGLATLPWGSTVLVRRGEQVRRILTGPATFHRQWRLRRLAVAGSDATDALNMSRKGHEFRQEFACNQLKVRKARSWHRPYRGRR